MILPRFRLLERQITHKAKITCPAYSRERVYLPKLKQYIPKTCDWRKIDLVPHIGQDTNECYVAATKWNLQMFAKMLTKHFEPSYEELRHCDVRSMMIDGGNAEHLLEYCMRRPVFSPKRLPLSGYIRLYPLSEEYLLRAIAQQLVLVGIDQYPSLEHYKGGVYKREKWERKVCGHLVNAIGYNEDNFLLKNNWKEDWGEEDSTFWIPRRGDVEDEYEDENVDLFGPLGIYKYARFPFMDEDVVEDGMTDFNLSLINSNMAVEHDQICYCDKCARAVRDNPIWPKEMREEVRDFMRKNNMR